jgi:peptidoglycan/xylan/chitin deacetylase (PgdA/CDA1 family)
LSSPTSWLASLKLELAYFSGHAMLASRAAGGAGAILRFERVRPRPRGAFQPLRSHEITPRFLDRAIHALKRWGYDIVTTDEACARAVRLAAPRRFACLTFDGAAKDLLTHAYPVLARHGVPFTIYVPTAFPDGLGWAWWLALETIIGREGRISLMMSGQERRFTVLTTAAKYELFAYLAGWLRTLAPPDLSTAIRDLCARYGVDLNALTRHSTLDWADLAKLCTDPQVTIGSATVNYSVLATMTDADARRELTMGKAVLEAALGREIRHLAFPFGDRASFSRAHVVMAEQAGFVSAVSALPGVVQTEGCTNLHALPRIDWDGRARSLRAMRVLVSGATFPPVAPTPRAPILLD